MSLLDENALDQASDALASVYDPATFGRLASCAVSQITDYLHATTQGRPPVFTPARPDHLFSQWPPPCEHSDPDFDRFVSAILAQSTHQHHPGFVGQQLSAPPPVLGVVAMLCAILNNSAAIFEGAPVASAMERRLIEWFNTQVGYGSGSGGVLTSGGSLGTLTALLAMRQAASEADIWETGFADHRPIAVLMSDQAHYCNRRACCILGFGNRQVYDVETGPGFAMDLQRLSQTFQRALRAGHQPVAVVASAGTTATGSHDDLMAIADFCEDNHLWMHVDAAHGGAALLSDRYRSRLQGIDRADSMIWDAHKMLMMPSPCTAVLFRDETCADKAFRQQADYLLGPNGEATWQNPASRNFECTKSTMAVLLYAALRLLGTAYLARYVEYVYDLARAFAADLKADERFELLAEPESNILCFRIRSACCGDNLQLQLREEINREGRFFIMRTVLRGVACLRIVIMNPMTRWRHLQRLKQDLVCAADRLASPGS